MPTPSATDRPAKKVAYGALFTALALIFSYIESLLPPFVPVPGIKLGLANAAVTLALYLLGVRQAICINVARIALAALLFGTRRQCCKVFAARR
jgi:heptaprenyl diphosphate synthase